jgi:hypothetical protein
MESFPAPVSACAVDLWDDARNHVLALRQLGIRLNPDAEALARYRQIILGRDRLASDELIELHAVAKRLYEAAGHVQHALAFEPQMDVERSLDRGHELAKLRTTLRQLEIEHQTMLDEGWARSRAAA